MRLNIESKGTVIKLVEMEILFAGILEYCLQFALEGIETFAESI